MDHNRPASAASDEPELLTLAEWAERCGYTYKHANLLSQQEGFPAPVPAVYREVPKRRPATSLPDGVDPEHLVTLDEFANLIGTAPAQAHHVVTTHPQPLPAAVDVPRGAEHAPHGRHRLWDLVQWWNARPATTTRVRLYAADQLAPFAPQGHPPLPSTRELGVDPAAEVTLSRFATLIGADRGNVGQYRRLYPETMPTTIDGRRVQDLAPGEQVRFKFEDLRRWWNARPGSRAGHRARSGAKGRVRRGQPTAAEGVTVTGFATQLGVDAGRVHWYRQQYPDTMPDTIDGRRPEQVAKGERARYRFEELNRWFTRLTGEGTQTELEDTELPR